MAYRKRLSRRVDFRIIAMVILVGLQLMAAAADGAASAPAPAARAGSQPAVREGTLTVTGPYPADPALCLWLPGSHGWPNLRHALGDGPPEKTVTFKTVEISNAWLTARFLPEMGFRLYDLTWNDDPLKRQPFGRIKDVEFHFLYRWEGPGYFLFLGSMKWGFPYFGHTTSDHAPWSATHGIDAAGNAWAEGTYTCIDTGMVGTVRAVLPKDAARLDFTFSVHNPRNERQAFDYSIDSHVPANRHVELALPAGEAITHQKSWNLFRQMFFPWPNHMGKDLRYLSQWDDSQGVFPADLRAGYSGFYDHSRRLGVLRVFPHERIFGVKYWMPGLDWGPDPVGEMFGGVDITQDERRYLEAGQSFSWQEAWYPVRDLAGIDGGNEDVAVRVAVDKDAARLHLTSTRAIAAAVVTVEQLPPAPTATSPASQAAARQLCRATVSLEPGRSTTVDLPAINTSLWGTLQVTVDTGRSRFAWQEQLRLLKPVYAHEELEQDRQAYLEKLRKQEGPAHAEKRQEHPRPAEGFLFRHAGTSGKPPAAPLHMPNACGLLGDGSIIVADRSDLKLFRPDLTFDRKLQVEGLRWPLGLCADDRTLYVADSGNRRIVCVDLATWKVSRTIDLPSEPGGIALWRDGLAATLPRTGELLAVSLAGKPSSSSPAYRTILGPKVLSQPFGLAADGDRLLVADAGSGSVLAVDPKGEVTVLADRRRGLAMPARVAVQAGEIYVLDAGRSQLLRLDGDGGPANVHVNGRLFGAIPLSQPADVLPDGEGLVVANAHPALLARVSAEGRIAARYDLRDDRWPQVFASYEAVCRRPNGDWLATDSTFHFYWFDRQGRLINQYGGWGRGDGQLWYANALASDSRGYVYVSDFFNFRVLRFDPRGEQLTNLGMDTIATDGVPAPERWYVRGLSVDSTGRLAVAVCGGQCIRIHSPAPENRLLLVLRPYDRFRPMDVSFDAKGNLFVVDDESSRVLAYGGQKLANCLGSAAGRTLTSAELEPAAWPFEANSGAMSILADGQGGCYVSMAGRMTPTPDGPAGTIAHFDNRGTLDRRIVSSWTCLPRQMVLDGDRLLVANAANTSKAGISEIDLSRKASSASQPASSQAASSQPRARTFIGCIEPPEVPGVFRDIAGFQRVGGADGFYQLLDSPRGRWFRLNTDDLSVRDSEPAKVKIHWSNPMPDGSVALHMWGNKTAHLCETADGQARPLEFDGVANPVCTVRDADGYWWVFNADRKQVLLFAPQAAGRSEPIWTITCGKGDDGLAEPFGFAPVPGVGAWTADRPNHRLVLLSREDGRILRSSPPGVVNEPNSLWRLEDGRLLVIDQKWGILVVDADVQHSRLAVRDMPKADIWEVYYDSCTGRLLYPIWQNDGATVGWAEPIGAEAAAPATAPSARRSQP